MTVTKSAVDFRKFSASELRDMASKIEDQISETSKRELTEVKTQVDQLLGAKGLTIKDIYGAKTFGRRRRPRQHSKAGQRLVNPANKEESWEGRGRKPKWLKALEESSGVSAG